ISLRPTTSRSCSWRPSACGYALMSSPMPWVCNRPTGLCQMGQVDRDVCDVLIGGSGAGGFAAALTAHLQGLDVIMAEKEPLFGGTTAYSAGVIWIPVNSHQKTAGASDSREDALAYL